MTHAVLVSLLAVGAWLGTMLLPVSETSVAPGGDCCSVMLEGRSILAAVVSEVGGAIPGAVVRAS
jgi:hypothetical protein